MSLRRANLLILSVVLAACGWLWQRDLAARDQLAVAGDRLASAEAALTEARRATQRVEQDLNELRGALARAQKRAEEMSEARAADRREVTSREASWAKAIQEWKAAVEARDMRIEEMLVRERELRTRLDQAAARLAEAARRLEEAERGAN
jgi:DNA repair exonuclease SbcCD ATPase subunit